MFANNSNKFVDEALIEAGLPTPRQDGRGENFSPGSLTDTGEVQNPRCFSEGTSVSVGMNGETRPIEQIKVGDEVASYDRDGRLVMSRVTATQTNEVSCVLDWFGTGVTPGHVTLCAVVDGEEDTPAGRLAAPRSGSDSLVGRHVPLIDILVADGAVMKGDGTLVRAATDEVVGSRMDAFVVCRAYLTAEDLKAGRFVEGRMRVGTKLITGEGNTVSVLDTIEANGFLFDEATGLVTKPDGKPHEREPHPLPFFGPLPKPEDYVLRKSGLTLDAIRQADEWEEGQRPTVAVASAAMAKLNRRQRRAMKAKSKGQSVRMH